MIDDEEKNEQRIAHEAGWLLQVAEDDIERTVTVITMATNRLLAKHKICSPEYFATYLLEKLLLVDDGSDFDRVRSTILKLVLGATEEEHEPVEDERRRLFAAKTSAIMGMKAKV